MRDLQGDYKASSHTHHPHQRSCPLVGTIHEMNELEIDMRWFSFFSFFLPVALQWFIQ